MRSSNRRKPAQQSEQPPRSEIILPFPLGSSVRVRYRPLGPDHRLGGGALNIYSGDDIAIHVNPRPQMQILVLNSHIGGGWGGEEHPATYPVMSQGEVNLMVWAGPDGFIIQAQATDEDYIFWYLYEHRLPVEAKLDRIAIDLPNVIAISIEPPR